MIIKKNVWIATGFVHLYSIHWEKKYMVVQRAKNKYFWMSLKTIINRKSIGYLLPIIKRLSWLSIMILNQLPITTRESQPVAAGSIPRSKDWALWMDSLNDCMFTVFCIIVRNSLCKDRLGCYIVWYMCTVVGEFPLPPISTCINRLLHCLVFCCWEISPSPCKYK
jgi:hypothetical protein